MATFLVAPDEADYEQDGAVLGEIGIPAPLTLSASVLVAPENFTDYLTAPPGKPMVAFG